MAPQFAVVPSSQVSGPAAYWVAPGAGPVRMTRRAARRRSDLGVFMGWIRLQAKCRGCRCGTGARMNGELPLFRGQDSYDSFPKQTPMRIARSGGHRLAPMLSGFCYFGASIAVLRFRLSFGGFAGQGNCQFVPRPRGPAVAVGRPWTGSLLPLQISGHRWIFHFVGRAGGCATAKLSRRVLPG